MKLPRSWLLPASEPVLALVNAQWQTVRESLDMVCAWAEGLETTVEANAAIKAAHKAESAQRRALHRSVRAAFSTPLDAEDIYELGERIGHLHWQLYLLVREATASETAADAGLARILRVVAAAAKPLTEALGALPDSSAADSADAAAEILDGADRAYRAALKGLAHDDVRVEIRRRELFRRAEHVVDAMARIVHSTWFAVCKVG